MKTIKTIVGYTMQPLSGKAPKGLLMLLHGYGGDGHHLFLVLSSLREQFPDLAIAVPNGLVQLDNYVHAWIRLSFPIDEEQLWQGALDTAPLLKKYISTELKALGLKENQLILLGFSQGSIMALHVGLRLNVDPLAIIALSGFLVAPDKLESISSRPPVYLINGNLDTVVAPEKVMETKKTLQSADVEVHHTAIKGIAHTIDHTVIKTVAAVISQITGLEIMKK